MAVSNMDANQETVYRTHEDSHVVMSEKVQSLAGSIYQELEKMIGEYLLSVEALCFLYAFIYKN